MKSLFVLIVAFVVAGTLTSCNKQYTCRCEDHFGNKTDYPFTATSRQKAKDYCESYTFPSGDCDLIHDR